MIPVPQTPDCHKPQHPPRPLAPQPGSTPASRLRDVATAAAQATLAVQVQVDAHVFQEAEQPVARTASGKARAAPVKKTAMFEIGDRVFAKYGGIRGTDYYDGTVTAVHDEGASYEIEYDDGDTDERLPARFVQPVRARRTADAEGGADGAGSSSASLRDAAAEEEQGEHTSVNDEADDSGGECSDGERAGALQEPETSVEQKRKLFQDDILDLQNEIRMREAQLTIAQERVERLRLGVDEAVGQAGVRAATKDLRLASTQLTSDRAVRA